VLGCELRVMLSGAWWYNCGAPRNGGWEGGWQYRGGGRNWFVGYLSWLTLLGVFPALLSDAPTLSSGRCCEPDTGPPVGARVHVFGGDPFGDIVCERQDVCKRIINSFAHFECSRRIVETIEGSSDLRWNEGLLYPFSLSWTGVYHWTFDPMRPGWEKKS